MISFSLPTRSQNLLPAIVILHIACSFRKFPHISSASVLFPRPLFSPASCNMYPEVWYWCGTARSKCVRVGADRQDKTNATHWTTQGTSSICFELQCAWKCSLSAPQITSELGTKPVFTHFTWSSLSHAQRPHSCVIHSPSCLGEPKHCLDPGHTGLAGRWASG